MATATWDSGQLGTGLTLSNGDLTVTGKTSAFTRNTVLSTAPKSSGKFYFEIVYDVDPGTGTVGGFGVSPDDTAVSDGNLIGTDANGYGYVENGLKIIEGTQNSYGNTWTAGDVLGCAVDLDTGIIWFSKNNTWQNSATIGEVQAGTTTNAAATFTVTGSYVIAASPAGSTTPANAGEFTLRTASGDFTGTQPTGYGEWNVPTTGDGDVTATGSLSGAGTVSPIHGDGTVPAGITLAGAGTVSPIHGTGGVTLVLTPEGVGTIPLRGDGAVAAGATLAGAGKVSPTRGTGGVTQTLGLSGTGTVFGVGNGAVFASMSLSGTGTVPINFFGDATLPGPFTITATADAGGVFDAALTLPALEADATALRGAVLDSNDITLPLMVVAGSGAPVGEVVLPSPLVSDTAALTGEVASGDIGLGLYSVDATANVDGILNGEISLFRPIIAATALGSPVAEAALVLPTYNVQGEAKTGEIADGSVTMLGLGTSSAQLLSDGIASAAIVLPKLFITGGVALQESSLSTTAWCVNTETFQTTNYTNYDFHTLGEIGGQFIGINGTQIVILAGEDDLGTFIDADVLTGMDDLGMEFEKNVDKVYLGYSSDGDMILRTNTDGEERTKENDVTHMTHENGQKRARVTLGKGVKSRYWQFGLRNCNGSDFEIESLGILARQLKRKA